MGETLLIIGNYSFSPGFRRDSSLIEGALGNTEKFVLLRKNFPVSPEAPSPRGLAAQQTGGVFPIIPHLPQNGRIPKKQAEKQLGLLRITFFEKSVDRWPRLW